MQDSEPQSGQPIFMSDRYIEKAFLFLLVLSLLLHVGVGVLLYYMPQKPKPTKEPVFIDLQQMPELKAQEPPRQQETPRKSEQRVRVPQETAPRGRDATDMGMTPPVTPQTRTSPQSPQPRQREAAKAPSPETPVAPGSSASGLLKPRTPAA